MMLTREPSLAQIQHVMVSILTIIIIVTLHINDVLTAITCSVLAELINGMIDYSRSPNSARYSYGTAAIYRCNPGYNITSVDNVRACTGDGKSSSGQWDGAAPQCPRTFYSWTSIGMT